MDPVEASYEACQFVLGAAELDYQYLFGPGGLRSVVAGAYRLPVRPDKVREHTGVTRFFFEVLVVELRFEVPAEGGEYAL